MDDSKVAALLEDIRSQFRVFGDGLQMLNEKIDAQGQKLSNKIDSLDQRVTSMDNRMISFDHRVKSMDNRLTSLDQLVASMDNRMISLDQRVISLEVSNSNEHRLILQMLKELSEEQQKLKRAK